MPEVDIGEVRVSLAPIPQVKEGKPTNFKPAEFKHVRDARALSRFNVIEPANLPGSFELHDAAVLEKPSRIAALTYIDKSRGQTIVLIQTPIAEHRRELQGKPTLFAAGDSIQEVSVGKTRGAVIDIAQDWMRPGSKTTIIWVKSGMFMQISGQGIERDELIRIAEGV